MRLEKGKNFNLYSRKLFDKFLLRLQNEVARLDRKLCESQIEIRNLKSNLDVMKSYTNILDDSFDSDTE